MQDTVLVVPPYPYSIEEDIHDVPLEDCVSQPEVQTQLRRMEGEAATSMRLTLGCGSLGVESLALAA